MSPEAALEEVYNTAISHIEAVQGTEAYIYFEGYEENVREYYDPRDFLLAEEDLVFFYQLYTLSPYAGGGRLIQRKLCCQDVLQKQ